MHSPEQIYEKITNWCAYQERSHNETKRKLLAYGLSSVEADEFMARLISENFISEERFAVALAGGKFRIKKWGRVKIRLELKKHGVSDHSIKKALTAIEQDVYENALKELLEKKVKLLKEVNDFKTLAKLRNHAISKGYETDLVIQLTNKFDSRNES